MENKEKAKKYYAVDLDCNEWFVETNSKEELSIALRKNKNVKFIRVVKTDGYKELNHYDLRFNETKPIDKATITLLKNLGLDTVLNFQKLLIEFNKQKVKPLVASKEDFIYYI